MGWNGADHRRRLRINESGIAACHLRRRRLAGIVMRMDGNKASVIPARGAADNPANRFEKIHLEPDEDFNPEDEPKLTTIFLKDHSATIIAHNDSPDVGFESSVNPYRGCEHGCIYCYARPTHEYLGFSAGLDFESRIMVKERAPELLRKELSSLKWKPQVIAMSGVTDCYQPIERKLKLTRGCLEVLAEFRNPVGVITKNHLVTRDIDVFSELARHRAAAVFVSVTTLDAELRKVMEPRTSPPASRLAAIEELARAGIPVGVLVAPVIPGLTDHEMPKIIEAAVKAGAKFAGFVTLRLPYAVAPLFENWLTRHFPDRKDKVLNRIRSLRDGKLNDAQFGSRMRGEGIFAEQIERIFEVACRKVGIAGNRPELSAANFRRVEQGQIQLFD
jgi:DNA repair photolyase